MPQYLPFPSPPVLLSVSGNLMMPSTSYKRSCSIFVLLCLASFTSRVFKIHPCVWMYPCRKEFPFFLRVCINNISLYAYTTFAYSFIPPIILWTFGLISPLVIMNNTALKTDVQTSIDSLLSIFKIYS